MADNKPSDSAIARAFWNLQPRAEMTTAGTVLWGAVLRRARELDATELESERPSADRENKLTNGE